MPLDSPPFLPLLQAAEGPASLIGSFAPIVLIFVVFWFLLIRPVQAQRKEQEAMRAALKSGDRVITAGGIHGTVTKVKQQSVLLRISDGVQVEVARGSIASQQQPTESE